VSKLGLVSLLVAGISFIIMLVTRFLIGHWMDLLWAPLATGVAGLIGLMALESKTLFEFLTMRTTKNGLNMGVIVGLAVVILASINFMSVRYDRAFDFTEEKINSLADQSVTVLDSLEEDLTFQVFYRGEEAAGDKARIKANLEMYQKTNKKVKVRFYNTYTENLRALQYLGPLPDKDKFQLFTFAEYKDKKVRVAHTLVRNPATNRQSIGYNEQQLTSAIVKATRSEVKKLYFLTNHGERSIEDSEAYGLTGLLEALKDSSFEVNELDFSSNPEIPSDAVAVAIIGPRSPLLDVEIDLLLKYAESGGKLLLAADPGERHNLALLTKPLGVEFVNNYVLSPLAQLSGRSMASAMGTAYSADSEITRKFNEWTIFDLASELKTADGGQYTTTEFVKTSPQSFSAPSLQNIQGAKQRTHSLAISSTGKYKRVNPVAEQAETAGQTEFSLLVFGDSDFMTNQGIIHGLNRDLALNSFLFLSDEKEMISIRPKQLKGTKIELTTSAQRGVILGGVALPLSMFVLSSIIWFRRRGS
jgi:ABC-type uncharacterized transport system involved in gliding motility auxiliary subunit